MDENRVSGAARSVAGKVEETVGSVVGDAATEGRGMARQYMGDMQNMYGQAVDSVRSYTNEAPLTALLVAGGIGMALGILLGRR
ncbi:MAG: CsbD family protein [Gemmatimonas sp.]